MAQNRPYPKLTRDRTRKRDGHRSANTASSIAYTHKYIRADRLFKPTNALEPLFLNVNTKANYGNNARFGTKNPGWRATIAAGGDATSSYSRTIFKFTDTHFRVRAESLNYLSSGYGSLCGGVYISESDQTALNDAAIGRLRNKLQGRVGNAQLAAPLAESREIHRLVRQVNDFTLDALKALLAAKKSKGKSISKMAGDIWLGLGFGVNPLLKDLQSAAESIAKYVQRQDNRITITGTANKEYFASVVPDSSYEPIAYDAGLQWYHFTKHQQSIRYVAGIDLTVRSAANYSVGDHLGLKLEALPSTLWELTAFSWVVDYFTTVGTWLEDMFYTIPGTVVYVSKNYKYQSETRSMPKGISVNPTVTTVFFSGGPSSGRYTNFTRTKQALVIPVRSLRVKSVDEIASHGLTKILNLGSVIAGRHGPSLKP